MLVANTHHFWLGQLVPLAISMRATFIKNSNGNRRIGRLHRLMKTLLSHAAEI